jgi:DeoR/GlpR family transcriptional regulator of sugar metabolism
MATPEGRTTPPSRREKAREQRQQTIASHVTAHGTATVNDLADLTGASIMTVHRDLDDLARRGVVRKFHGGVSAQPSTVFESSSEYRLRVQMAEKEALAGAAIALVEPGMSVMIDTSTTNLYLADELDKLNDGPRTVATNYLPAMQRLRTMPDIHLIGIGGDYNTTHDAFLGMSAIEAISALTVDIVFLSTSAMTATMTYHQEPDIVMVKRAMLEAGQRRVLLMDPTKLDRTALHRLCPVADFDHLVINSGHDDQLVSELREHTDVTIA